MNAVCWIDVETSCARASADTLRCPGSLKSTDYGSADSDDAAAVGVRCIDSVRCRFWDSENLRVKNLVLYNIILDL